MSNKEKFKRFPMTELGKRMNAGEPIPAWRPPGMTPELGASLLEARLAEADGRTLLEAARLSLPPKGPQ